MPEARRPGPDPGPAALRVGTADLADPGEGRAVLELLDAYARDPMGGGSGLPPAARAGLLPLLRSTPGALVLLAWLGERPVGVAVCLPSLSTFRAAPVLNIHDLAVLPEERGRGAGKALLAAAEAAARGRGCCKLTLEVREDNRAARALYARAGYGAGTGGDGPAQYLFLEKRLG